MERRAHRAARAVRRIEKHLAAGRLDRARASLAKALAKHGREAALVRLEERVEAYGRMARIRSAGT